MPKNDTTISRLVEMQQMVHCSFHFDLAVLSLKYMRLFSPHAFCFFGAQ